MKKMILTLVIATAVALPCLAQDDEDILGRVLSEVGFDRSDLGYTPKGYWSRFPLDVPYKLTSFDDLFAEPMKLYDFSTLMGNSVEHYMNPTYADSNNDGLYKLVYTLGVDKKLGGFRTYGANLVAPQAGDDPLASAVEKLYLLGGQLTSVGTFGADVSPANVRTTVAEQTAGLPDTVRIVIAGLITNLADAIHYRNLAFRNCDPDDMRRAIAIRDLAQTQGDGQVYYPELDDIAQSIDLPSLHYAALKVAAAAEAAERALIPLADQIPDDFECEIPTPFGKIAIFSPVFLKDSRRTTFFSQIRGARPGWMSYDCTGTLCVIDFGRNSIWYGGAGAAASLDNPISVLIDLDGDDYYGGDEYTESIPPTSGVGLCGVGLVLDTKGNDHYYGNVYAQGVGLFGVGVLYDRKGKDDYRASESAQGCGYFGIGLCLDVEGNDKFYIYGDGQGMGGVGGGVGVLACYSGNDEYTAEPYAEVFNRADYHSQMVINASNAQGAGFGRRGDGSDGHAWAGGLGALIDIHGHDLYYAGNFSLGIGYWFGTGILFDKNGDDHYKSCYFTQASGAHYCNGVLIDENGNDFHELFETAGAGLAFGWDYTNALLINKNGNDRYTAKMISYGLAQIRSNAFFVDLHGNDEYLFKENAQGIGAATWQPDFEKPHNLYAYNSYVKSFGTFIDIGGTDKYLSFDSSGRTSPHPLAKENSLWLQPARVDSTFGANNYGVGIDVADGTVPEFYKW